MSKDEIERLVKEAEKYKEEDTKNKERIESKNELENYLYSTRSTIVENEEVKMSEKDKEKIREAVEEGLKWLEANQAASKEEYDAKREKISDVISPIIGKMYAGKATGEPPSTDDLD
jgi:molecular chaperone DnaK (HSP70)